MAVYDRTQGQLPAVSQTSPALPSRDISSILVQSLQNALEGTDGGDDSLPDKIADGINKSDLVKVQKGGVSKGDSKSPIDDLLNGGEKNRTKAYEKHLKKEEDAEKKARAERAARDRAVEKAFDTTLRGLSTFAQNPLKGLDNALQAGFKRLFKFGDRLLHKTTTDLKNDMKKMGATVTAPIRAVGKVGMGAITGAMAVGKVVGGGVAKLAGKGGGLEKPAPLDADALLKKDGAKEAKVAKVENENATTAKTEGQTKGEKDAKEAKEGKVEKKRDKQAGDQLAAVQSTNLTVGMIFGKIAAFAVGIAAIALLVPIIAGKISELVLNFKYAAKETPVKFGVFMRKAKAVLFGGLFDLAGKLKWPRLLGGGSFLNPALTEEEKAEKETLANTELVKDYEKSKKALENYTTSIESAKKLENIQAKIDRGEKLDLNESQIWQHREQIKSNAKVGQELQNKIAFWEQNVDIQRWNELNEPGNVNYTERYKKEAEEYEQKAYYDLYAEDIKKGNLTKAQVAWIATKGGGTKSGELMEAISQHVEQGGPYKAETGLEATARRGGQVAAELQNVFGELGHNLTVSTKREYQRHDYSPDAELRRAVNNYQTNNTRIEVQTSGAMGK